MTPSSSLDPIARKTAQCDAVRNVLQQLEGGASEILLHGLPASLAAFVLTAIHREQNRTIVLIAADEDRAESWRDDLMSIAGEEAVHYFGERDKLFKIHFRNVSNPMPEPWTETLMDDGYQDMHRVMQALRAVNFDGAIIPDHIPELLGGSRAGVAYSIAYMRALVQAANNESGGPV